MVGLWLGMAYGVWSIAYVYGDMKEGIGGSDPDLGVRPLFLHYHISTGV